MPRVGPSALEIGYWVDVRYARRGIATEAAGLLVEAAFEQPETTRVEIHCDEANVASAGVPARLGFELDRVEWDEIEAPSEIGRSMTWTVDREAWLKSRTSA